jgi:hypothetical protein
LTIQPAVSFPGLAQRKAGKRISRIRSDFFFQLMLVVVSFSWFSLGKSWQELGSLLETKIFNQIDKGFEGVAAMNV